MFDIKSYLKDKSIGFYASLSLLVLFFVTAIVYPICYAGTVHISWVSFGLLLAALAVGCVLMYKGWYLYVPVALGILGFLALLFYIYGIYYYVSIVLVGIDLTSVDFPFILCTVLYSLIFVVSIVNIFLPHSAKEARND